MNTFWGFSVVLLLTLFFGGCSTQLPRVYNGTVSRILPATSDINSDELSLNPISIVMPNDNYSQAHLIREKRGKDGATENEIRESAEEEAEESCVNLPPNPPKTKWSQSNITLLDLLNGGCDSFSNDDEVSDAILLLGNTGSGKTTLSQIMAGDLSRLHAVLTQSGRIVIIDDDNRIGAPSTVSKTLVPELFLKEEKNEDGEVIGRTAFYDCPGFDDTRGPEKDIAANFFMNQIMKKVARVKMLFLVIQSSVKIGNDRLDFDLMVSHATKFIKNVENYRESIALVVTKVDSYNNRGRFITDKLIMNGITAFLHQYNNTLHSELESNPPSSRKEILQRKIQFVETLLQKDGNGSYSRISFSRSPNKCGPLIESEIVNSTKTNVTSLIHESLQYTKVNPKDFGYTLKSGTMLTIRSHSKSVNEAISRGVSILMSDVKDWYIKKYLETTDVTKVTTQLEKDSKILSKLISSLGALRNNSNPQEFLKLLKSPLAKIGYSLPIKFELFLERQQKYLKYFDEITGNVLERSVNEWVEPVKIFFEKVKEYKEWYDVCEDLQRKVATYDWQLYKPPPPRGDNVDWLEFIKREFNHPVKHTTRNLAGKLDKIHLGVLDRIMRDALKPAEIDCNESSGKATISGNYVRLTEFIMKSKKSIIRCNGSATVVPQIEVYATNTLFIDKDIDGEGKELNVVMIAPRWVIIGGEKTFNFNGATAPSHRPRKAEDGSNSSYINVDGGHGNNGLAGKPGISGSSFFGIGLYLQDIEKLQITSVGGKGGLGQSGGDGGHGSNGQDAEYDDSFSKNKRVRNLNLLVYQEEDFVNRGVKASNGGNGGNGGIPGFGGKPGLVKFISGDSSRSIEVVRRNGEFGVGGSGGKGGIGGEPGNGLNCEQQKIFWMTNKKLCKGRGYDALVAGRTGHDGVGGCSGTGLEFPASPVYNISEWKSVLNFKKFSCKYLGHNETANFINFLDSEQAIAEYFDVEAFVAELEQIVKTSSDMESLLISYIKRVEQFLTDNLESMGGDSKKVAVYLLASAYSQLISIQEKASIGMVLNIENYFGVVRKQMELLKDSSALVAITTERKNFSEKIKQEMAAARRFISDVVTPAWNEAEIELNTRLMSLGNEFEKIILSAEYNLEMKKSVLVQAMKAREEDLGFKQILRVVTTVLRFVDLIGGISGALDMGLSFMNDVGNVGTNAVEVVDNFKEFLTTVGGSTSGEGQGVNSLITAFVSAQKLLRSASDLLKTIKGSENDGIGLEEKEFVEDAEVTEDNSQTNNDFTKAVKLFGEEALSVFANGSGATGAIDNGRLIILNELVQEAEITMKDAIYRKVILERSFTPAVESVVTALNEMIGRAKNKSEMELGGTAEWGITRWQVTALLRDVKTQLEMLGKGISTSLFVSAVDKMQDSLTMMLELFAEIEEYEKTRDLALYMSALSSAHLKPIQIQDSELSGAAAKAERAIRANLFTAEYKKALYAFKQWVFPFAKLHLTGDLKLNGTAEMSEVAYMKQVERIQLHLQKYRASSLGIHDEYIIHSNFSSTHKSTRPFFVWKGDEWGAEIQDLLAGKQIVLKSDVRLSKKGKDAVKFKLIEIDLKIPESKESERENQRSLNSELEHFGVLLTHSGLSYYRFKGNFYAMAGANQTIRYNFERDGGTGNRLGTNRVYEKFKCGDYLLSPYTLWTVQLVNTTESDTSGFRRLERFAPYVDLELVGSGIYVDSGRMNADMELDRFYVRDDSIREGLDF